MGRILPDVDDKYFRLYGEHRSLIKPFLHSFDITFAKQTTLYGAALHIFLAKPSRSISAMFGFSEEILIVYSFYDKLQPRIIQGLSPSLRFNHI